MNNKIYSTISGDIIASSSLDVDERRIVISNISTFISDIKNHFNGTDTNEWVLNGRITKGDSFEFVVNDPRLALRIAILLKTFTKSLLHKEDINNNNIDTNKKKFYEYGIRIAVGIGEMNIIDFENGILDGQAIYLSGRLLQDLHSSSKKKIIIKKTLYFESENKNDNLLFSAMFELIDTILNKTSARQSEILYYKFLELSEKEIAGILNINQSAINQHSTSAGYNAINNAVSFYENYFKNI